MANALYDKGREGFLDGSIDWDTDTIKAILIRTSGGGAGPYYTLDLANDNDLADIPSNGDCRPVSGVTISSKTVTAGVADGSDTTFPTVASGDPAQLVVVYADSGVEATSRLIAAFDTMTGLPITPNGGNIKVTWSSDSNRIFKL